MHFLDTRIAPTPVACHLTSRIELYTIGVLALKK